MKIFGHIVCHNEYPDILRAIESIYPICDEILVVHDGSTQPLIDFLETRKDIYKMKVFYNPFTTVREQRQFLMEQTPIDNWVVSLDADEKYSMAVTKELRNALLWQLSKKHYETSWNDQVPLVIAIPHFNLIKDILHYDGEGIYHQQKIFYYQKGLHWDFDEYFTHLSYKPGPLSFEKGDDTTVYSITGKPEWVLLHYARLNPERLEWRSKHINDPKYGKYEEKAWEKSGNNIIVPIEENQW